MREEAQEEEIQLVAKPAPKNTEQLLKDIDVLLKSLGSERQSLKEVVEPIVMSDSESS
jgi:hypothetical protein